MRLTKCQLFHPAISLAESIGVEPIHPLLSDSLANCCLNRSANSPFIVETTVVCLRDFGDIPKICRGLSPLDYTSHTASASSYLRISDGHLKGGYLPQQLGLLTLSLTISTIHTLRRGYFTPIWFQNVYSKAHYV